jgi:hypothetical protein
MLTSIARPNVRRRENLTKFSGGTAWLFRVAKAPKSFASSILPVSDTVRAACRFASRRPARSFAFRFSPRLRKKSFDTWRRESADSAIERGAA